MSGFAERLRLASHLHSCSRHGARQQQREPTVSKAAGGTSPAVAGLTLARGGGLMSETPTTPSAVGMRREACTPPPPPRRPQPTVISQTVPPLAVASRRRQWECVAAQDGTTVDKPHALKPTPLHGAPSAGLDADGGVVPAAVLQRSSGAAQAQQEGERLAPIRSACSSAARFVELPTRDPPQQIAEQHFWVKRRISWLVGLSLCRLVTLPAGPLRLKRQRESLRVPSGCPDSEGSRRKRTRCQEQN